MSNKFDDLWDSAPSFDDLWDSAPEEPIKHLEPPPAALYSDNSSFAPLSVKREYELSTGEAPTIGQQLAKERGTEGKTAYREKPATPPTNWNPVSKEFASGFGKGAASKMSFGTYNPQLSAAERGGGTVGGLFGGVAPMALSAFPPTAPFAVPLMIAEQGLPATAGDVEQTGELRHPAQAAIDLGFAAALAELPPAVGRGIVSRLATGGGIGEAQSIVTQQLSALAADKKLDLSDPDAVRDQVTQTLMGIAFGGLHAPEARAGHEPGFRPEPEPNRVPPIPVDQPAAPSFDALWESASPEAQAPDPMTQAPKAAPPELVPQAPDAARERYVQQLRAAGIPEEQIQAGMQHVDRAPIQNQFDQVEVRAHEPEAQAEPTPAASFDDLWEGTTSDQPPENPAPPPTLEDGYGLKAPTLKPKPKPAADAGERPVIHVGDYVAQELAGQLMGRKNASLRVNPEDVLKLGLYNGPVNNPEIMSAKDRMKVMGKMVKIDPTAPTLSALAHKLNENIAQHQGEPLLFVGHDAPDPDHGYHADDLAAALTNRPRTKQALAEDIAKARNYQMENVDPNWVPDEKWKNEPAAPEWKPGDQEEGPLFQHTAEAGIPEAHTDNPRVLEAAAKAWNEKGTESPFFKKWFGGSKVVDEAGKPLTVYHGTAASFDRFDPAKKGSAYDAGKLGEGFYFSGNENLADAYSKSAANRIPDGQANIMPVHLSLKNPIVIKADRAPVWEKLRGLSEKFGISADPVSDGATKAPNPEWAKAFTKAAIANGHDGVVLDFGSNRSEYVAFKPEQIKSATGNRGTFDAKDPSILYQRGGKTPNSEQSDMFGNQGPVASQGFIKGKNGDKGLGDTPLFGAMDTEEKAKTEKDQQTLFQKEAVPPDPGAQDPELPRKLAAFHAESLSGPADVKKRIALGKVNPEMTGYLNASTGLHLPNGMVHTLDNFALRHIDKAHGPNAREALRGQAPITAADIARIPEIIAKPDHVEYGGKNKIGRDTIKYQKAFEGVTYYVEEVRAGKQELAAQTMYKERTPAPRATPEGDGAHTSETFRSPDTKITPAGPEVNPRLDQRAAKGSFHQEGQKSIITLFSGKADFSTWMHEHAHFLRRAALAGEDHTTIRRWLESEGIKVQDENGKWTTEAEERFARGFERYLRDGKAPTAAVKPIFEKIRAFMREIYQSIRGTDLEAAIPEHVRFVYDRLVGARDGEGSAPRGEGQGRKETLFQAAGKGKEEYITPHVGPGSRKIEKAGDVTLGSAVSYEAGKGEQRSGWISKNEKFYTDTINEAHPLEKIQKVYEQSAGVKVAPNQSIKYAINRVLGSGGSANLHLEHNLMPIIQGGEVGGIKYPRLTPEEARKVDDFAVAKDAIWRYNNTKGYDNPALTREHALRILDHFAKYPADLKVKIERAADGLVAYSKDLARRKMEAGLPSWTPDKMAAITRNPHYVPEVRDFDKVMSKPVGGGAKKAFTSMNSLVRGTFAVDVAAPTFDPISALISDTHQFATETAKMSVWNRAIDLVEANKTLQGWIKRMPKEWVPAPHEGSIKVIRPGEIHLTDEQMKMADRYKKALFALDSKKTEERDDRLLGGQAQKIREEKERLSPSNKMRSGETIEKILSKVDARRQFFKVKRMEEAEKTMMEFRLLPERQRNLIQDFIDEGEPVNYLVPKEISDAVNGMTPIEWAWFQKPLVAAAGLFRKMQVGWNPDFTLSNTPRDVQEAYFNVGLKPWMMFKGLYHYFKKDDVYQAFLKEGGAMEGDESGMKSATNMSQEIRYGGRFMKDRYNKVKDPFPWKDKKVSVGGHELNYGQLARMAEAVKKTAGIPFETAEAIGEAGEMMTRLGVMDMAMKEKKLSGAEAADLARQATLDFKRIGAKMKGANALIPFLNARIQGMDRLVRTAKDDPKGAAIRALISAAAPTAALLAWNRQNPNYQDIASTEKEYYWILMKDKTGSSYFKIAKGFLPQLITNPIQMAFENMVGTAKKDWWKIGLGVLKAGLPVDDVGSTLNPGLKIPLELSANYDFYFDRDIVKSTGKTPGYQYDPNTAETLKTIGRGLGVSPAQLQHVAQGLLGGTASNILFAMDMALGRAGLQPKSTTKLEYMPFVKRVFGQTQDWKSDLAQRQRELFREKKAKEAAFKSFEGDIGRAEDDGQKEAAAQLQKGMDKTHAEYDQVMQELGKVTDAMDALEKLKKDLAASHNAKK